MQFSNRTSLNASGYKRRLTDYRLFDRRCIALLKDAEGITDVNQTAIALVAYGWKDFK